MKETKRIATLFNDLYSGSPWLGTNLLNTLQQITATNAARKVIPQLNSIWEIVSHLVSWRENVLKRVQGNVVKSPADNYFSPITDTSDKEWQALLKKLDASQNEWIALLEQYPNKDLKIVYPPNEMTYYENIHGILQHDAYHLGQIVILAKALR